MYTTYIFAAKADIVVEASKRINVTFPLSLLKELREFIPRQERNQFIIETVEKELRRRQLSKALQESAGAWSDEDHPDLMTVEDVNGYVRRLRETALPRSWDEIASEAQEN